MRFCLCCFAFSNARFFLPALPFPWLLRRKRLLPQALRRLSLMEAESGRILFAQNASLRLPMASTTKIMTALVVLRLCALSDTVTVTEEAAGTEGSSMYLESGEQYTVESLLYGLMLESANDAAVALAIHAAGSPNALPRS